MEDSKQKLEKLPLHRFIKQMQFLGLLPHRLEGNSFKVSLPLCLWSLAMQLFAWSTNVVLYTHVIPHLQFENIGSIFTYCAQILICGGGSILYLMWVFLSKRLARLLTDILCLVELTPGIKGNLRRCSYINRVLDFLVLCSFPFWLWYLILYLKAPIPSIILSTFHIFVKIFTYTTEHQVYQEIFCLLGQELVFAVKEAAQAKSFTNEKTLLVSSAFIFMQNEGKGLGRTPGTFQRLEEIINKEGENSNTFSILLCLYSISIQLLFVGVSTFIYHDVFQGVNWNDISTIVRTLSMLFVRGTINITNINWLILGQNFTNLLNEIRVINATTYPERGCTRLTQIRQRVLTYHGLLQFLLSGIYYFTANEVSALVITVGIIQSSLVVLGVTTRFTVIKELLAFLAQQLTSLANEIGMEVMSMIQTRKRVRVPDLEETALHILSAHCDT
ncbi:hypothetical protein SK128_004554 [Halocaridina rubra]|uniref:Uncharacterized protein n=1 Tax=Halocaridina rubra TaxID=373956 RepID=A0AAN8WWS9_HALRR